MLGYLAGSSDGFYMIGSVQSAKVIVMKLFAEIFSKLHNKWRGWSDDDLASLRIS